MLAATYIEGRRERRNQEGRKEHWHLFRKKSRGKKARTSSCTSMPRKRKKERFYCENRPFWRRTDRPALCMTSALIEIFLNWLNTWMKSTWQSVFVGSDRQCSTRYTMHARSFDRPAAQHPRVDDSDACAHARPRPRLSPRTSFHEFMPRARLLHHDCRASWAQIVQSKSNALKWTALWIGKNKEQLYS